MDVRENLKSSSEIPATSVPVHEEGESDSDVELESRVSEYIDPQRETHGMTGEVYEVPDLNKVKARSDYLKERLEEKLDGWDRLQAEGEKCMRKIQQSLTIARFKDDILDSIHNNQVVIVSGDTGCGKSTQVPQWILDDWTSNMNGGNCNILVTQPRRISAISLARRVAHEREEELGECVGYQVRLDSVLPRGRPGGNILFCSSGIVLRRLQSSQYLSGVTHVLVDEAHMRDLQTDFLITLLNDLLPKRPDLKLILMSASMNTELFHRYFNKAPLIHVPGNLYPVDPHYLDDCGVLTNGTAPQIKSRPSVNLDYMVSLIDALDRKKPPGAILCFLPGWQEIKTIWNRLEAKWSPSTHWIIPVHSRLSNQQQSRMFETPPPNVRKIILATNIAETSITVNDVVYVVDSGVQREARYDSARGVASMGLHWSSKANITQRKGRAGRVQPGESFHLFPESLLGMLPDYPEPEMCCSHLAKLALDTKLYIKDEKIAEFLSRAPDPPPQDQVQRGIEELKTLNILDKNENLTDLGRRVAHFTTLPAISKSIIYSALLRCVDPVLSICTILSSGREPFSYSLENKAAIRELKASYHPTSDHLALAALFREYETNEHEMKNDLIDRRQMKFLKGIKKIYAEHLYDAYFVNSPSDCFNRDHPCNEMADNQQVVLAALLCGLGSLLRVRSGVLDRGRIKWDETRLLTSDRQVVSIGGESVNYEEEGSPYKYLMYHGWIKSMETRQTIVRDTSPLLPTHLLLMGGSRVTSYQTDDATSLRMNGLPMFSFSCNSDVTSVILSTRSALQETSRFLIKHQGLSEPSDLSRQVMDAHIKLVYLLSQLTDSTHEQTEEIHTSLSL